jgi:hypothetical protein
MSLLVGLLLTAVALAVVLRPFLRSGQGASAPEAGYLDHMNETQQRRESVYRDIASLQVEHGLGQIGTLEYEARLQEYRLAAASLLRDEEGLAQQIQAVNDALESEIQEAQRSSNGPVEPFDERRA